MTGSKLESTILRYTKPLSIWLLLCAKSVSFLLQWYLSTPYIIHFWTASPCYPTSILPHGPDSGLFSISVFQQKRVETLCWLEPIHLPGYCNVVRAGNLHFQRVGVGPRRPHDVFIGVLMAHLRPWRESSNLWSWRRIAEVRPPRNMGRQTPMMGTFLRTATGFRSFQVTFPSLYLGWWGPKLTKINLYKSICAMV